MKFVATKKVMTINFFSPLSFVAVFGSGIRDPGSGMGKNQDPGTGIRDKHPGSATLLSGMNFVSNFENGKYHPQRFQIVKRYGGQYGRQNDRWKAK